MKTRSALIILHTCLAIGFAKGCQKDEYIDERDYPRIDLNDRIIQEVSGISLEGIILTRAGEITDKGFVWKENAGASLLSGSSISVGPGYENGTYTAVADYGLTKGSTYEVRAYLISEGRTVYSKTLYFTSTFGSSP